MEKRKCASLVTVSMAFVILFISGCAISEYSGWHKVTGIYHNNKYGYSILFPDGWIIKPAFQDSIVGAINPSLAHRGGIQPMEFYITANEFKGKIELGEVSLGKSYEKVAEGTATIDHQKAKWMRYNYIPDKMWAPLEGSIFIRYKFYRVIRGSIRYTIYYTTTNVELFSALSQQFEDIVKTIKFDD